MSEPKEMEKPRINIQNQLRFSMSIQILKLKILVTIPSKHEMLREKPTGSCLRLAARTSTKQC